MDLFVIVVSTGDGAAVLIRAVDAVAGLEKMHELRMAKQKSKGKVFKDKELGNGPSKLTQALSIDKATFNQNRITSCDVLWLENGDAVDENDIVTSSRVGVDYAKDWAKKPLRFYILGNKSVSVRDKNAEADIGHESEYYLCNYLDCLTMDLLEYVLYMLTKIITARKRG